MTESLLLLGSVVTQGVAIGSTRASEGLRRPIWVLAGFAAMGLSVVLMSQAIARGVSLAIGYGIWSGSGIVLAVVTGVLLFGDHLRRMHLLGLGLVLIGVVVVYGAGT